MDWLLDVFGQNTVEIERQNPQSPLFSVKSFEELNLHPKLLKVISFYICSIEVNLSCKNSHYFTVLEK